jgi:predicted DNA-binding protein YlxM (UPF0122 family)
MKKEEEKGCVYFFRHIGLSPVKIGYSSSPSPIKRFEQFRTYAPFGSEILGFIQTYEPSKLENQLHSKYTSKRINGEWFELTQEEVDYEINFHSSIEDIREKNEFQIAWAKKVEIRKELVAKILSDGTSKYEAFERIYRNNPKISVSKIANDLNVSRTAIYLWIKKIGKI